MELVILVCSIANSPMYPLLDSLMLIELEMPMIEKALLDGVFMFEQI